MVSVMADLELSKRQASNYVWENIMIMLASGNVCEGLSKLQ